MASTLAALPIAVASVSFSCFQLEPMASKVFWNATTPCQISVSFFELQHALFSWAMHHHSHSATLALMPVFSWVRGMVHKQETDLQERLAAGGHNIDMQFYVPFGKKTDERDERPGVYPGTLFCEIL